MIFREFECIVLENPGWPGESPLTLRGSPSGLQRGRTHEWPERTKSCLESLVKSSRPKVVQSRQKVTQSLVKSSQVLSSLVESGRQKSTKATLRSIYEKPIRKHVFQCQHLFSFVFDEYISNDNFCVLCVFCLYAHRSTFWTIFGRFLEPKMSKILRSFQRF